jgi:hypothetical protein
MRFALGLHRSRSGKQFSQLFRFMRVVLLEVGDSPADLAVVFW